MFDANKPFDLPRLLPRLPSGLNIFESSNFVKLMELYAVSQKNISELNGLLKETGGPELFLNYFYLQESISSSEVENIHTTLESALEDGIKEYAEQNNSNKEVLNYRRALMSGHEEMRNTNLSSRTIKNIHKNLSVPRGNPGEYRRVQNKIVSRSFKGDQTIYTPPSADQINGLMSDWENFVHSEELKYFPLIKTAICHYQFEAIHPFLDGNGRSGRILMVLQLVLERVLDFPVLLISSYLSRQDNKYKNLLLNISAKEEWMEFIIFMLKGYSEQAIATRKSLINLENKKKELKSNLYQRNDLNISRSNLGIVIDHIFKHPMTHPQHMAKETKIHWQTCSRYLKSLEKYKYLRMVKSGRYKMYRNHAAIKSLLPNGPE